MRGFPSGTVDLILTVHQCPCQLLLPNTYVKHTKKSDCGKEFRLPMRRVAEQWLRDILRTVFQQRSCTRADIIRATGLNAASVSHALRYLLQRGTILKVGELQSNGGRPREVLSLNGEAAYFLGVDLEGSRIRFGLFNLVGDIRCRWEEDLEFGQPLDLEKLVQGIKRVLRGPQAEHVPRLLAVGVSYPGLLDEQGCLTAVNLGWQKFPLVAELEKAIELPVFLEHDKHTSVLAERWLGGAQKHGTALYVIVERGIGIGILIEGRPVAGWRGMAGELGHCKVEPDAEDPCKCGARGCLEAIASSPNIVRQYVERKAENGHRRLAGLRVTDVFDRARQKDAAAQAVLARAARALGLALSHATHLLNPEIIILGGDVISGEDVWFPLIKEQILRHTLPPLTESLTITVSGLGLDIRLKGAMSQAFRRSLSDSKLLRTMCSPVLVPLGSAPIPVRA